MQVGNSHVKKCKQWSLYEAYRTRWFSSTACAVMILVIYNHINEETEKMRFLTALKSSKSLSSLSVPKAAIRC